MKVVVTTTEATSSIKLRVANGEARLTPAEARGLAGWLNDLADLAVKRPEAKTYTRTIE